ncbi:MAG: type II toxin-antitoxin system RatA family toxin [Gammaproteobacteria bacterium]|mgnify:CR=1 FL=1|jgi:ribosome-associated toxin RatA of RatAB toxin-antitoxin module|nr:type II toxin-antitoxin system RatA family toxin [Gammaproteobacteria bacterium]MBT3490406.1 type II toxin-antitoxin system RatA family toxin [Gammaproteobacteria bacterium]MBT3718128.1 type II toxin-antitoxin system RatA family toxin [Gammaproteobacteria bacterium]MBT3845558.1 type II toxin-antitoxin system RatA family toxin [Gammaproteobacteria bacterium]MBT3893296.1 type II toxin-antitoxin system RatA family toxin [Gammaproteobacteria bacterium]
MAVIEKSALVAYSSEQMYALVEDVPGYHHFLPWCGGSRFLGQSEHENVGEVDIAFKGVHQSFATRNRLMPGRSIEMSLVKGPFKALAGRWSFDPLSDSACKVTLHVEFDFSSRIIAMAIGPLFNQIVKSMVDAFVKRAQEVYVNDK